MQKESISRHRRKLHRFKRRKVFVGGPYTLIQSDTIFYRGYARQNNGYKYILAVLDCFSRKNWVRPMKTTTAEECARNLDSIIGSMPYKPTQFASDQGNEFHPKNPAIFNILVEKYGLIMFTLKEPLKASIVDLGSTKLRRLNFYFLGFFFNSITVDSKCRTIYQNVER